MVLSVNNTALITKGMWVRIIQDGPANGGLVTDLMQGMVNETSGNYVNKPALLNFNTRVMSVGDGYITIERALPYNVSTTYNARLYDMAGEHLCECGCVFESGLVGVEM